jgi:predicted amidohydrolase YtcJ|tara:strand:+ start:700 stop:2406 length:1707 start_codon:yes stop_codon:yes gene_type:complete
MPINCELHTAFPQSSFVRLKLKSESLFFATLLAAAVSLPRANAQPDSIYFNGKILKVDAAFTVAEAVSVKGGRISAVGKSADLLAKAGASTRKIDLKGRTVIPGLIDNHMHYLRGASRWRFEARIDGVISREAALRIIADKAKEVGPGNWVFVLGGWSEQQFADKPGGFTQDELDRAAPDNPVFIQKSYSRAYMNSLASSKLPRAGGSGNLPRGSSGSSARSARGESSGRSRSSSSASTTINAAIRFIPQRTKGQRVEDVAYFNADLNRLGLTTVYDVGRITDGNFDPVIQLAKENRLSVRVYHTLRYRAYGRTDVPDAISAIRAAKPDDNDDWFGVIGIGEHTYGPMHDSAMGSTIFGRHVWSQFEQLAAAAAKNGWHIHEHAMQDSTAAGILDIAERLNPAHPMKELRWTIAHCDLISEATIKRAQKLGLTLAVHNKTAKPAVEGRDSPPVAAMQKSGIVWGLGSDGTVVATINPFHTLWWVTSGKVFPNRTSIRKPISRAAALTAHTRSNAYLMFKEKDLGSIEVGKLADMVVLDRDYLTVPVGEIRDIKPVMTIVGGRLVYLAQ